MGIQGKAIGTDGEVLSADTLVRYGLLEECIRSGQVPEFELHELLREDPVFARWLNARTVRRASERAFSVT